VIVRQAHRLPVVARTSRIKIKIRSRSDHEHEHEHEDEERGIASLLAKRN
jgi:hypothetical protein